MDYFILLVKDVHSRFEVLILDANFFEKLL